jgi:hypothetical protein
VTIVYSSPLDTDVFRFLNGLDFLDYDPQGMKQLITITELALRCGKNRKGNVLRW